MDVDGIYLEIKTGKRQEFLDITKKVEGYVSKNKIKEGVLILRCPHTTAGVFVNENYDPAVTEDILDVLERIAPEAGNYKHTEGNAHAHIKSALVGKSVIIFIEKGKLQLGTWEGIFFAEFDGPRRRKLQLKLL